MKRFSRNWREKINIYFLYIWKKFRDSKIRTKLLIYLVMVAIICSGVIGGISYITMKNAMIDTTKESAISLMKQLGIRMEERIREFQDASYSFGNKQKIFSLMDDGKDISISSWEYNQNRANLIAEFLSVTSLYNYSDFVILESSSNHLYYYDQGGKRDKVSSDEAQEIMDNLRDAPTETLPAKWVKSGERVYFVRKLVRSSESGVRTIGTIAFAISDDFFILDDDEKTIVSNEKLIVSVGDEIFKNNSLDMDSRDLQYYLSYKQGKYYIYAMMREVAGEKYLVIPMRTVRFQWNILCFIPYAHILEKANLVIPRILVTTAVLLAVGLLMGFLLYRNVRKNLNIIQQGMYQYESGDYSRLISPATYDEIGCLILQFNHMGMKIHELNELTRREEEEKQELQYQVMEAQINPHFLYNTLGSLKWLAYEKEQTEIAKLADAIINLLRFTVKHANQYICLREELTYINNYIYIQQTRYEDAFQVETEVSDDAMDFQIIGYILQPFIENSILHGIDNAKKDGIIWIKGEIAGSCLCLSVSDNGKGMTQEKLLDLKRKIEEDKTEKYRGFNGIGITNIILRLKMVYGKGFRYSIESEPGRGTSVCMYIPERTLEDEKACTDR
ncbi:sensor histidine kinase [Blautia schinkii]|nr:sensor histidine kinase [Blautia schinkii]